MAKPSGTRKQGAARRKAKPVKTFKDLEAKGKSHGVKGGKTCIPVIAILIGPKS